MFDNSDTKPRGSKAPDYVCKDPECIDEDSGYRTGVWASDTERNATQGAAQATGAPQAKRVLVLDSLFAACFDAAYTVLDKKVKDGRFENFTIFEATIAASALLAARTAGHPCVLKLEKETIDKKKAAAAEAEKKRLEEERERYGQLVQKYDDGGPDDGLPF